MERLKADLWRCWCSTYLASLGARSKWRKPGHDLQPGDLVLIKDEALRNRDWPLARVEKIHPGEDGIVRAATLRCRDCLYNRPACRLVPLLFDREDASPHHGSMSGSP